MEVKTQAERSKTGKDFFKVRMCAESVAKVALCKEFNLTA